MLSFCYLFATFLLSDCYHSLFALHKQGTLAMYTSPRRKGAPSESRSSLRADHPRLNPTPLAINPAMPDGLANASRSHSKLCTRSPLSGELCAGKQAFMPASTQIDRHSPACIAMQPRRNHQARFFTIWTGKDAGNRLEGAEMP